MKFQNKKILTLIFLICLNLIIALTILLIKVPSIFIFNPIILIFGFIELFLLNIFAAILFNQYIKYKKKIFGEILKFKITLYLIINILSIFIFIIAIYVFLNYSPSINKLYDDYNFSIEEKYLGIIDKINEYKIRLNNLLNNKAENIIKTLMDDPYTIYLKVDNKVMIEDINYDIDPGFVEEINTKKIEDITLVEIKNSELFVFNDNNICLIYKIPQDLVNSKKMLFELITKYKKIYSHKKNTPIITFVSIFLIIIPFLFFQVFFLFKYISNLVEPLQLLVNQFKKLPSEIYSPIPLPKKRFDEFAFLIIQFNRMQKQLEQRAVLLKYQERFEILSKVTSRLAHELKNPLTPIVLSCELIEKKYPYQDNYRAYLISKLKIIQENVNSIRDNINKFYSLNSQNNEETVPILVNDFFRSIEQFWNSDWIELKIEIPEQNIYLYSQKDNLESLFNNLIINSYEATNISEEERCKIFIRVYIVDDKYFNIIYTDNGSGINENEKNKIFEPYFTTKEKGSGFGLSIIKSIIENINGLIEFIGNGKIDDINYKGATFLIKLPYVKQII
ncbi:MAG TPA: ATP-binding protein [Exilispira sp.]|nr:ATP-binding protein [Exilispira sp.]